MILKVMNSVRYGRRGRWREEVKPAFLEIGQRRKKWKMSQMSNEKMFGEERGAQLYQMLLTFG